MILFVNKTEREVTRLPSKLGCESPRGTPQSGPTGSSGLFFISLRFAGVPALSYQKSPHAKCRDYIAAIERELFAWGVLTSVTPNLWHW